MNDLNVFLTLTPPHEYGLAAAAFRLPHNSVRYTKPPMFLDDDLSRETTPCDPGHDETSNALDSLPRILLTFDEKTKVKGRVIFGSDPDRCDVLLTPKRGQLGISGQHFYVTFDDQQQLIIRDVSTNGLSVGYDGQGGDERRRHFQWILLWKEFEEMTVFTHKEGLCFNVHLSTNHMEHEKEYKTFVKEFMAGAPPEHEVAFDNLVLHNQRTPFVPSEALTPNRRPIYLNRQELGEGGFGRVWKIINASSGHEYAGKEFFFYQGWNREIEIMKQLDHDHIVQFIDFRTAPTPLLVMEYLPLGNLEARHKASPISDDDMKAVFHQSLEALSYLHRRKITHRDLKPENILLHCESPIHIKIADFGLAQNKSELKTFCGSPTYAAPENFLGRYYTNAVDIWSLGVIVMKFIYGLGRCKDSAKPKARGDFRRWGQTWCRLLIQQANDWDSDEMIDFLTDYMLSTPRAQPDRGGDDVDPDEVSTVMGPLWQGRTVLQRASARFIPVHGDEESGHAGNASFTSQLLRRSIDVSDPDTSIHNADPDMSRLQFPRPSFSLMTHLSHPTRRQSPELQDDDPKLPPLPHLSRNSNCMFQANFTSLLFGDEGTCGAWDPASTSQEHYKKDAKRKWSVACEERSQSTQLPHHSPQAMIETTNSATNPVQGPSPEPKRAAQLVHDPPGYVTMTIDGKAVSLRTTVNMAGKTTNERAGILRQVAQSTKVDVQLFNGNRSSWVPLKDGAELCQKLGVAERLKPLLDHGGYVTPATSGAAYLEVEAGNTVVYIRTVDFWINASSIWRASGRPRHGLTKFRKSLRPDQRIFEKKGSLRQGTYVSVPTALEMCTDLGLDTLKELVQMTLKNHGYRGELDQRNDQQIPPVHHSSSISSDKPSFQQAFFRQAGSSFLGHPNPSPQEVVWKS